LPFAVQEIFGADSSKVQAAVSPAWLADVVVGGSVVATAAVVVGAAVVAGTADFAIGVVVGGAVSELPPQAEATNKATRSAPIHLTASTLGQRLIPVLG
jgi:hypothetical protein